MEDHVSKPSRIESSDLTRLLDQYRVGDGEALTRAFEIVYGELRRLAQHQLASERKDHTLVATALVHEAYLKLLGNPVEEWRGRGHFFHVAARAMRQILVEHARRRGAQKRGAGRLATSIDDRIAATLSDADQILALDSALDRLGNLDERARTVVEYKFFCGLSQAEIAELLSVSERTVERIWTRARAWLYKELYPADSHPPTE